MLEMEIEFYNENKADWLSKYSERFIIVKGRELVGVFNTSDEALAEGARRFGLDSFLIRRVTEHEERISIPALTLGLINAAVSH